MGKKEKDKAKEDIQVIGTLILSLGRESTVMVEIVGVCDGIGRFNS